MNRVEWPSARRRRQIVPPDPAVAILDHVAAGIQRRAPDVLRVPAAVEVDRPEKSIWPVDRRPHRRVWRCEADRGIRLWMTLDDDAVRALLAIVLGGPASERMTQLEREIVKETVERLSAGAGLCWEETATELQLEGPVWRSAIRILASETSFLVEIFAPAARQESSSPVPCIDGSRIPLRLTASILRTDTPLQTVAAWQPGLTVRLCSQGDPAPVALYAGPALIARGLLGVSQSRRAIRIDCRSGTAQ